MMNVKIVEPKGKKVKGIVQIVHGFAERVEHYSDFIEELNKLGYICVIHDQKGFGGNLSKSEEGVVENYDDFLDDITTVRKDVMKKHPNLPVYMFAHSLGGNIGLTYLITRPSTDYKKAAIEAPCIDVIKPFPDVANKIIYFLSKLSPKLRITGKIRMDHIGRDQELIERVVKKFPSHNKFSFRVYSSMILNGKMILENAKKLTLPTLLTYGTDDKLVSINKIKELAKKSGNNVKTIEYEGGYHQLHHDIIKKQVIKDIADFLES